MGVADKPFQGLHINGARLERYARLLALQAGVQSDAARPFRLLGENLKKVSGSRRRALRVCVVTYELEGPVRNRGMASESADIAVGLARMGHEVTVLYVPERYCEQDSFDYWVRFYGDQRVELVGLTEPVTPNFKTWLKGYSPGKSLPRCRAGSYNVYLWLKDQNFDIVHSFDNMAPVYYCLLAKQQGLGFDRTLFHIRIYGPDKFRKEHNAEPMRDPQELAVAYMERRVVELADVVTAASSSLFDALVAECYALSVERCYVLPYIGCHHQGISAAPVRDIDEIVFVGSLEPRKGIHQFVEGVSWLDCSLVDTARAGSSRLPKIRFLGGEHGSFAGRRFVDAKRSGWRLEAVIDTQKSRFGAITHLARGGKLAVIASLEHRPSVAIFECLRYGIPLIASNTPAHREVLGSKRHGAVLFDLHPKAIAEAIALALTTPVCDPARDPVAGGDPETWDMWHEATAAEPSRWLRQFEFIPAAQREKEPLVSVCVAHFNRPHLLKQSLASLEAQTYRNFEVILVDDGSTNPEAIRLLDELEPVLKERQWRIIRQENRYLGAARNTGARHARGKYCLFMDDDNFAKPAEIETFVKVAESTGADILTCFADLFSSTDKPDESKPASRRITQVGDDIAMGLFKNGFGDSNCFVRRALFLELGGNTEDYKVGKDDQEFFARAVLNGAKLHIIPEALYWYRQSEGRLRTQHYNQFAGELRVLRSYLEVCPPVFRDVLRLALGQAFALERRRGNADAVLRWQDRLLGFIRGVRGWKQFIRRLG